MPIDNWGQRMMDALNAVRQMHSDCGRLLLDIDRALPGYRSVYGSIAMMNISYDVKRGAFMPDGLLRHWVAMSEPSTVIAVNIAFWDDTAKMTEPTFIVAKVIYAEPPTITPDGTKGWDPWYSHLKWTENRIENVLAEAKPPAKRSDILRVVTMGVPLASLTTEVRGHEIVKTVQSYKFDE